MQIPFVAVHAGMHLQAEASLFFAAPLADVTSFDDDVMAVHDADAVLLHVLDCEAAQDHVTGVH